MRQKNKSTAGRKAVLEKPVLFRIYMGEQLYNDLQVLKNKLQNRLDSGETEILKIITLTQKNRISQAHTLIYMMHLWKKDTPDFILDSSRWKRHRLEKTKLWVCSGEQSVQDQLNELVLDLVFRLSQQPDFELTQYSANRTRMLEQLMANVIRLECL